MPDTLVSPPRLPGRWPCRPFTTADAMTLVAAVAVGYALLPNQWRANLQQSRESAHPVYYLLLNLLHLSGPFWLTLTLAFGVIRLRAPHPPRRRLLCQPGTVACVAILVPLPPLVLANAIAWATAGPVGFQPLANLGWLEYYLPPSVLGAWTTLRLTGRWRPEPGWIDPLGMTLGGGWIAGFVALLALLAVRLD